MSAVMLKLPTRRNTMTTPFKRHLIHISALTALTVSTFASAQVTFYENEDFRGRSFVTSSWINDFSRYGFNDRASSVIVSSGRWEVCEDMRYRGRCVLLQTGHYDSLRAMNMNNRISSVRPVVNVNERPIPMPSPDVQSYEYQRRPQERLLEVPVTSARAVVGPPEQRCWMDREQVSQSQPNVGGAIAGALIGGILGHQVGGGVGKDLLTGGGALAGGVIGSRIGNNDTDAATREVRRCETTASTTPVYWDVTYIFRGMPHHVQMRNDPGRTITVNDNGEPRQ
jgi:uncharacterized protein YcfJ